MNNTIVALLSVACMAMPMFGTFIWVGKYLINTKRIQHITKKERKEYKDENVKISLFGKWGTWFDVSEEDAKELLEFLEKDN